MSSPTQPENREKTQNAVSTASLVAQGDFTQAKILEELRELKEVTIANALMANDSEARLQALWNTVLSVLGVTFAVTFGVFAILAWNAALTANGLSNTANDLSTDANTFASQANDLSKAADLMALVQYCQVQPSGTSNSGSGALCVAIEAAASSSVSAYAASLYGIYATAPAASSSAPSTTSSATNSPSSGSSSGAAVGKIVGIVIGAVIAASIFAVVQYHFYNYRRKRIGLLKSRAGIFSKSHSDEADVQ